MFIEDESSYRKLFLGVCKGIGLVQRGPNDLHVCMAILTEDDEHWFRSEGNFSSAWIDDLKAIITEAEVWIENNCDPDMYNGRQYGWKFRS